MPWTRSCAGPLPVQVDLVPAHEPGLDLVRLGAVDGIGGPARPALALRTVVGEPQRTAVRSANVDRMPGRRRTAHTRPTARWAGSTRRGAADGAPPHPARAAGGFPPGVEDDVGRAGRKGIHPTGPQARQPCSRQQAVGVAQLRPGHLATLALAAQGGQELQLCRDQRAAGRRTRTVSARDRAGVQESWLGSGPGMAHGVTPRPRRDGAIAPHAHPWLRPDIRFPGRA